MGDKSLIQICRALKIGLNNLSTCMSDTCTCAFLHVLGGGMFGK